MVTTWSQVPKLTKLTQGQGNLAPSSPHSHSREMPVGSQNITLRSQNRPEATFTFKKIYIHLKQSLKAFVTSKGILEENKTEGVVLFPSWHQRTF